MSSPPAFETVRIHCNTCGSLRVILLDDVGGYRETPANQQEENVEADCRCETPPKRDLGGICAKIDLAQRGARCKIQVGGLVRSPTKTKAADDEKSADHAVASMADQNLGMDTMVSNKFYEERGPSKKTMD